ncbi:MAG: hypothetical protein WDO74_13590 [Pseudomonadota bacterium]
MICPTLETVAAWTLDELELGQAERFEEHYFECDICLQRAAGMRRVLAQLEASLPPILTAERRRGLAASQSPLPAINVRPGERATIRLGSAAEVGLWVMHASLARVMKVDFEARSRDGALLFALSDVPFDERRGEVVLACQVHYRSLPAVRELHVRLTATDADGSHPLGDYILDHEFESL